MSENNLLKNPSTESWYVAKYALEDHETEWREVDGMTEGEQKSLVYYLLTNLDDANKEDTLGEIIRRRPALLEFYRADLMADLEQLEELGVTDLTNWGNLAIGASNEEIDSVVSQFKSLTANNVVELLLGANTDYALHQLAQLVKDSERMIREIAKYHHVIITPEGGFERRFLPDSYSLFEAVDGNDGNSLPDGLDLLIESEKAVEGGKISTCRNQILALLNADFSKIPPFKGSVLEKIGSYHFFSSNCEECDAWLESNVFEMVYQQPWKFRGTYVHYEKEQIYKFDIDPEEVDCDPDSAEPLDKDIPANLIYIPQNDSKEKDTCIATLGGKPKWVQSPEIPNCPKCNKMMFYIGQNQASNWSGSIGDQVVFGFACEDCMQAVQVMQCT